MRKLIATIATTLVVALLGVSGVNAGGFDPVSASGLAKVDDGWSVMVDVVELRQEP